MSVEKSIAKIGIEDFVEAAATGALRALDARRLGQARPASTTDLVKAGFFVDCHIICGGRPPAFFDQVLDHVALNPQPEPPLSAPGQVKKGG